MRMTQTRTTRPHLSSDPGAPGTDDAVREPGLAAHTPLDVFAHWPASAPLAAAICENPGPHARWSVVGLPEDHLQTRVLLPDIPAPDLESCIQHAAPPFAIGVLPYELGHRLEASSGPRAPHLVGEPHWVRIRHAYIHDAEHNQWYRVGSPPPLAPQRARARLGAPVLVTPERYTGAVRSARESVRRGDIFQANVAHPITRPFSGSPRVLFEHLGRSTRPRHGVYLEMPSGDSFTAVCSFSPELFLAYDAMTGTVVSRPMKGTRTLDLAGDLRSSAKDAAELAMITDLMRNDLGRVCVPGSIRVTHARDVESHATGMASVAQGVSTVRGTLRDDKSVEDLLGATFPPGSVTGAPKIQAMRTIADLEAGLGMPSRDAYCGGAGWIDHIGSISLNVAIRTCTISGTRTGTEVEGSAVYPVGAGIVADSDPESEWLETLTKGRAFLDAPAELGPQ